MQTDTITYKGVVYPARRLEIVVDGNDTEVLIATESLSDALGHLKEYRGLENNIDSEVYFYVPNDLITASDYELAKSLDQEFDLVGDYYVVDYENMNLQLRFDGEWYFFDLQQGDIGEFWHGFEHKGKEMDLNYFIQEDNERQACSVYGTMIQNGHVAIDMSSEVLVEKYFEIASIEQYVGEGFFDEPLRNEFVVRFTGSIVIEAKSQQEAQEMFEQGEVDYNGINIIEII